MLSNNKLELDNTMLLQARAYVNRLVEGFSAEETPTDGAWHKHDQNPKKIMSEGKVVGTFKNDLDAGYVSAVQPNHLKLLLVYVSYLEQQLEGKQENVAD